MKTVFVLMALAMLVSSPAIAYEQPVHVRMTKAAVDKTGFGSRVYDYGASLGLQSLDSPLEDGYSVTRTYGGLMFATTERHTVLEWLQKGSYDEDDGTRPRNHFYNPLMPRANEGLVYWLAPGHPSLDWALGQMDADSSSQTYSLTKAKEYLYQSVTADDERERRKNLVLFFQSLGHAMHLVQDLGQPQHTRNDVHTPWSGGSLYESWTDKYQERLNYGDHDAVRLTSPDEAWTTCRRGSGPCSTGRGLADYTNREFVTAGTNFTGRFAEDGTTLLLGPAPGFPNPSGVGARPEPLQATDPRLLCPEKDPSLIGETWFIETPVTDLYTGTTDKVWGSTLSIFDPDLRKDGKALTLSYNACNAQSTQRVLVPRAVSYSAGLLNYFSRAGLEIGPPSTGAYAYADHATATGFSSITATIKKPAGEHLRGGNLVLAVKFHRNNCYKPDLSGEFTVNGGVLVPPCPNYREVPESVVVSEPLVVYLNSGEQKELTFKLKTELPMNATDVYLQVVYRGKLESVDGTTVEWDGIAVGTRDISEPTFYTLSNVTDMFAIPEAGKFKLFYGEDIIAGIKNLPFSVVDSNENQKYDGPPEDVDVNGGDIACELRIKGNTIATIPALPQGRLARLALLVEPVDFQIDVWASGAGFYTLYYTPVSPKIAQRDYKENTYVVSPVYEHRETKQFCTYWFYRYYPLGPPPPFEEGANQPSKQIDKDKLVPMKTQAPALAASPRPVPPADARPDGAAAAASRPPEPAVLLMNAPLH